MQYRLVRMAVGALKDEQGAVVPGATVTLVSETRGTKVADAHTNENGDFVFPNVPGDTYTVAFAATNQAVANEAIAFPTESSAREYMRRRIAADGSLADALHVIPTVERAA